MSKLHKSDVADAYKKINSMNKKLIALVALAVIASIVALWSLLRLPWIGNAHNGLSALVLIPLLVLAFPMRLYSIFFMGENASWSLPALAILLVLSGIFWGLIVERIVSALTAKKSLG